MRGATVEPGGMLDPETTNTQRARGRLAEDRSQILGCLLAQIVSVTEREDTMAPEANNAERARECARVKRWQQAQWAKDCERVKRWQHERQRIGLCRCGARIVAESRSRCWECLERCRRNQAARRGRPVRGRRRHGRPMLGSLSVRRRAFEHEERLRGLRRQRQVERERKRRLRRLTWK